MNTIFNLIRYLSVYVFCLTWMVGGVHAQKTATLKDLKATYVLKFIDQTSWSDKSRFSSTKISVLDSGDEVFSSLQNLISIRRIRNVFVRKVKDVTTLEKSQVLFVSGEYLKNIRTIYNIIQNKQILLITDQCVDKEFVMLNLIMNQAKNQLSFEVNKANIILEGLSISPKLILLGGTEIDVRDLYKRMRDDLALAKENLQRQNQQSQLLQKKIEMKTKDLANSEASLKKLRIEYKNLGKEIDDQSKVIVSQNERIQKSKVNMEFLNTQVEVLQKEIKGNKLSIAEQAKIINEQNKEKIKKSKELNQLSDLLAKEQQAINVKQKDLIKQKKLVKDQKDESKRLSEMLVEVQQLIKKKQDQLNENKETIESQVQLINNQKSVLFLIVILLLLFIALILSVIRAYRIKRDANDQLEKRVTERTQELDLANQKLKHEMADRKIAEQKEIEHREKAYQSSKLASLGTLVAGVGHEINNPNEFIMLNTPMLKDVWHKCLGILEKQNGEKIKLLNQDLDVVKEEISQMYDDIIDGSNRIKAIVSDLRDYAKPDAEHQKCMVDINQIIQVSYSLMKNQINKSTDHFELDLGEQIPEIQGNRQQLEQVLINLLQNACHALKSRDGKIGVRSFYDSVNKTITISVSDEGIGISDNNLKRIKDPFFTTKRNLDGMGLGLAISSRIIDYHEGELIYDSEEGKGTEARLIFRVTENA